MATHKLFVDDFDDASYLLFAIHCRLEDYRLVYYLNKVLDLQMRRCSYDVDFEYLKASFPLYEWENVQHDVKWTLVGNICKKEEDGIFSSGTLFNTTIKNIKTFQLIPEMQQVDYFLKVENDHHPIQQRLILDKINSIPQVAAAYEVDACDLKSRENLIFS